MKQKIEEKRQLVISKKEKEIKEQIKLLGSTKDPHQIKQIEAHIESCKQKVRELRA